MFENLIVSDVGIIDDEEDEEIEEYSKNKSREYVR